LNPKLKQCLTYPAGGICYNDAGMFKVQKNKSAPYSTRDRFAK